MPPGAHAPTLPGMSKPEETSADLWATGVSPKTYPTEVLRPHLDDFGHLGAVKQHADVVLGVFREEMYHPGYGVDGATELIVAKNRNGPTGFVDLYFYRRWMRFEDMVDPDR